MNFDCFFLDVDAEVLLWMGKSLKTMLGYVLGWCNKKVETRKTIKLFIAWWAPFCRSLPHSHSLLSMFCDATNVYSNIIMI